MEYINEYVLDPLKNSISSVDLKMIAILVLFILLTISIYFYYNGFDNLYCKLEDKDQKKSKVVSFKDTNDDDDVVQNSDVADDLNIQHVEEDNDEHIDQDDDDDEQVNDSAGGRGVLENEVSVDSDNIDESTAIGGEEQNDSLSDVDEMKPLDEETIVDDEPKIEEIVSVEAAPVKKTPKKRKTTRSKKSIEIK